MKHVIIITGAGKGIGRAIALAFAEASATTPSFEPHLVLVSRSREELETLAAACRSHGASAEVLVADIASVPETRRIVDETLSQHGTVDCLVNNAGVGRFKPIEEMDEEDFDHMVETNLKGTFFLTQRVFEVMRRNRSGHLIFITSVAAEKAFPSSSLYSMTKFGQKGLVEAMRVHAYGCNVRVTNVMPGAVCTPMWGEAAESMKEVMMMPEEIAAPVVQAYLLPQRTSVEEIVLRPVGGDINE